MEIRELSDKQMKEISTMVSSDVISYFENKDKITKEKALHNTKLLLRNYMQLKKHCTIVNEQLEEDKETFWDHKFLDLDSLMQNKAKTVKIMKIVDKSLEHYKDDCMKAKGLNESRRYDMIKMRYLNRERLTVDDIADRYDIARTTVDRNLDQAFDDLSVLMYGVEAFIND